MTSQSAERIGGWLLAPLAWLLVALLSASLSLLFFANALMSPQTYTLLRAMSAGHMALWVASLLFALAMWYYTLWLTIAFFKRRSVVPKHYIIWLLITLLLAIKAFAFSPVSDVLALRQLLFPLLPQTLAEAFPRLRIEFHDQTNDALIQALQRGEIDFGIGAIDSSLPAELLVYPLREDPFVAVLHRDDPLAAQAHLPWKQLVGRDIAVFSKGNIQRLVAALVESHRLTLTTRYQVDYIETLYGLVRSRLAVAILPALYTTHLQDQALRVAHLQQPALARTVALMRGPQALPPLIEDCFSLLQAALR
jgi:hypothetical protein